MKKRLIYMENGERKCADFDMGGGRNSQGLWVDKEKETEYIRAMLGLIGRDGVEYLCSVFMENNG